jgi:hypothetical protein
MIRQNGRQVGRGSRQWAHTTIESCRGRLPARPGVRVASDEFGVELTFDTRALGKGKFHTAESSSSKWSADDDGHELLVELTC